MAFSSWFSHPRHLNRRCKSKFGRSIARKAYLTLEELEDRSVPSSAPVVSLPQLFVADVYFTELGQSASAAQVAQYSGELLPGFTATDVAGQILATPDFQAVEIRQFYVRLAGFDPGSGGVNFWLDLLTRPGNTMDTVRVDFLSSDVYYNRVGGTNTAYVSALFGDVWNKPVDSTLLNQDVNALNNGASRSAIATAFVTDPRGYQAQIIADYDKVLDHDPATTSINAFVSFRQSGGTNEQILGQLHGSSELLKHLTFFQSNTVLTDADIAAQTFRSGLRGQIQAEQTAQTTAINAAAQAQKDAVNAAADETDAAMQVSNAKAAFNDPTTAQTAATQAQNDANDALNVQDSDAKAQVNIAQTALASAEPTPTTIQAVKDAQTAEAAASASANLAKTDAANAKDAANAATSTDLPTFLMGLQTQADAAAAAFNGPSGFIATTNSLALAAANDASGMEQNKDDDTKTPDSFNAQDIANDAFEAIQAANGGQPYPAGSQAAQLIDAATAAAQAAQTGATASAGFANDAQADGLTVLAKAVAAQNAANLTDDAVKKALADLTALQDFNFFNGFDQFFFLLNDFFTQYNLAVTQEALAVQANSDGHGILNNPQNDPQFTRSVLHDKNEADGQLFLAILGYTQTNTDISQAAAAAQAANNGGTGTGNNGDGDNNGGKRPGGGRG